MAKISRYLLITEPQFLHHDKGIANPKPGIIEPHHKSQHFAEIIDILIWIQFLLKLH